MTPYNVYQEQLRALRNNRTHIADPGNGGTIVAKASRNYVTLSTAGTATLETASRYPVDVQVLVLAKAAVTVNGVALADGDWAVFVTTDDSSDARQWSVLASSVTPADGVSGQGSTLALFTPAAASEDIAAGTGGAVSVATYYTTFDTDAGGDALTLADGKQVGQLKKIQLITDGGGDGVLTPANLSGGTIITFADAGDFAVLLWDGDNWVAIELGNAADGVSAPALS